MSTINILCCYYVHGLDGWNRDFKQIKEKVEESFDILFDNSNVKNNVVNFHYGYCSNDNNTIGTHFEFKRIVDKSFKELHRFLEENALPNFKKENEEKYNNFENTPCNLYFSVIGHSLGGLILRDLVKHIYSPFEKENVQYENYFEYLKKKFPFITSIKPCTFLTLSSPHLGSLACNESGGLYKTAEKTAVRLYCNLLSGKIGKVFTYKDAKDNEKPTLIRLSQKQYMEVYEKFPNRTLIGCIRHDIPVKFCSAMGDLNHPINEYDKENILIDERNGKSDTRICSYAGYEGQELEYYKKEIFNENVSKDMYYSDTKNVPSPNIEEQIKTGLKKINYKEDENTPLKYGKYKYKNINIIFFFFIILHIYIYICIIFN